MPVVPIFQGGVPRVGATTTPTTPLRVPQPTIDYERTFQQAMQPISQGVEAVGKILEVNHARDVKAASDEAEAKFMQCVQNRLLAPDTGYLSQQGKNAVDQYQPTNDALRTDMSNILGGLTPDVRAAVESRIQDRFLSAQGQMLRWNSAQTQAWHLESSESRKKALIEDSAQHYGDENYLASSWLSVAQEVEYEGRLRGWDEETKCQQMQANYDLFQAQRYSIWAQDDPVSAFSSSQSEREHMSPDVWAKVDASLWSASKTTLAYQLAQAAPEIMRSRQRFEQPDFSDRFNTKLSPDEEAEYQKWAKENNRAGDVFDYDLRGAWKELKAGGMSEDARGHLGDKYKKPNHPTFSDESIYANGDGGKWSVDPTGRNVFTPGKKISEAEADYLRAYFARVEPGAVLNLSGKVTRASSGSAVLDPMQPTGIPLIDGLSLSRKLEIFSSAKGFIQKESSERKDSLKREIQNSLARAAADGVDTEPLSLDQFIEVYGEEDGPLQWDDYSDELKGAENRASFSTLDSASIAEIVRGMKPKGASENYAVEYKQWVLAQKAAKSVLDARAEDPIAAAQGDANYGLTPITDWSSPAAIDQIETRAHEVARIASAYQTSPALLSNSELTSFTEHFSELDTAGQSKFLLGMASRLDDDRALGILAGQLATKSKDAATALFIMSGSDPTLAAKYLTGVEAVKQKRVVQPKSGPGSIGDVYSVLGADPQEGVKPLSDDPKILRMIAGAASGLMAYGELSGEDLVDAESAVNAVLGTTTDVWNGRRILMPKKSTGEPYGASSIFDADFEDLMKRAQARIGKESGYLIAAPGKVKKKDFASTLLGLELISVDDGRYQIVDPKWGRVLNPDRTPYILDLNEKR